MLASKAIELIRELNRVKESLSPFNDDTMRQIFEEIKILYDENLKEVAEMAQMAESGGEADYFPGIVIRHGALERNKRCLVAYVYERLQRIKWMRWEFGSVLPGDIKVNMSEPELQWFNQYSRILASYMRSIGNSGLDLIQDRKPPKFLYIEVRCLVDYGDLELDDGTVIVLKKNTQHFLMRSQCEHLIRQGILEHLT